MRHVASSPMRRYLARSFKSFFERFSKSERISWKASKNPGISEGYPSLFRLAGPQASHIHISLSSVEFFLASFKLNNKFLITVISKVMIWLFSYEIFPSSITIDLTVYLKQVNSILHDLTDRRSQCHSWRFPICSQPFGNLVEKFLQKLLEFLINQQWERKRNPGRFAL
jgi:hypothetical protein